MIYHVIIGVCLAFLALNLILNLRNLKVPGNIRVPKPAPMVSILVAARNEEDNIGDCLMSLQKQDYPNFEVLILDDRSTDNTAEIVNKFVENDSRFHLITGEPLPEGWVGKAYACHQLAKRAKGDWFLFTDADTMHKPNMISSVLTLFLENRPTLLSGFPQQKAHSLVEKITIPVFYFILMAWMPLWWLQRSKKLMPSMANGQFLLFNREDYWKVGGHEAVKSRILEDVWLGAEVYRKGGRVLAIDLSPVVSCRMYKDFSSMWKGFAKSIYGVTQSMLVLLLLGVLGYMLFLGPFYALCDKCIFETDPRPCLILIAIQVLMILFMRLLMRDHFKESIYATIFHPLGLFFFLMNAGYVIFRKMFSKGIEWKERHYSV